MFRKAATRRELQQDSIIGVEVAGKPVALYLVDGEVLATSNICPHAHCILSGSGDIVDPDVVECSCHGSQYNFRTGELVSPPASEALSTYPVEIRGDEVFVDVD